MCGMSFQCCLPYYFAFPVETQSNESQIVLGLDAKVDVQMSFSVDL